MVKRLKKRAAKKPRRERLQKSDLARRLEISRPTLDNYLKTVGAPQPDKKRTYDVEDVLKWITSRKSAAEPKSMQQWKIEEVKLRCEKMRDAIARDRGEYISKTEASRTIIPLMAELGDLIRQKFVLELPGRCRGRDQVEIAGICEKMLEDVIKRFRSGSSDLLIEAA